MAPAALLLAQKPRPARRRLFCGLRIVGFMAIHYVVLFVVVIAGIAWGGGLWPLGSTPSPASGIIEFLFKCLVVPYSLMSAVLGQYTDAGGVGIIVRILNSFCYALVTEGLWRFWSARRRRRRLRLASARLAGLGSGAVRGSVREADQRRAIVPREQVRPPIRDLMGNPVLWLLGAAALALAAIGDPAAVPVLTAASADSGGNTRIFVAHALGQMQVREAIPPLLGLLQDADDRVRICASSTLVQLRAREAVPQLLAQLSGRSPSVAKAAAHAIAQLGDQHTVSNLRLRLCDRDPYVGELAAETIGFLDGSAIWSGL
ncbi:MAG TPA: HEAT repeat domain-containing protein [Phycisphaerae bacterium]|nr:HEAT repeat domain-containing protein [Phycisphaerae bacterium]